MWNATRHHGTRLGSLLVKRELITNEQLNSALELQRQHPEASLGQILVEQELINETDLQRQLRHQKRVRLLVAILAVFTAPFQWAAASPVPTASANAQQVAQQEAAEFARSPQLNLHDPYYKGERFSTDSSKLGQRVLKKAYDSLRASSSMTFNAGDKNGESLNLGSTGSSSYTASLSETKVMLKMKFRFRD